MINLEHDGDRFYLSRSCPTNDTPVPAKQPVPDSKNDAAGHRSTITPWYESDFELINPITKQGLGITGKEFYQLELRAMNDVFPDARLGKLKSTGELYWIITVEFPVNGERKKWSFMLKYDQNHPHENHSVKIVPILPSVEEITQRASESHRFVLGKTFSRDQNCLRYLRIPNRMSLQEILHQNCICSAATFAFHAIRWAYCFESGFNDPRYWDIMYTLPDPTKETLFPQLDP